MQRVATEEIQRDGVIGFEVAAAVDGKLILNRSFGFRDLGKTQPMTPSTMMPIGSLTKSVTAALVEHALRKSHHLETEPLSHFLGVSNSAKDITLIALFRQTTGLKEYNSADVRRRAARISRNDELVDGYVVHYIDRQPRVRSQKFEYSNSNYFLLGLATERMLHHPLRQNYLTFLHDLRVPANDVRYGYDSEANFETGFDFDGFSYAWHPPEPSPWAGGAGGLQATAAGVVKLNSSVLSTRLTKLLEGEEQTGVAFYDRGWYVGRGPLCQTEFYHDGVNGAYRAYSLYYPRERIAIAAIGNTSSFDGWRETHIIARNLLDTCTCHSRPSHSATALVENWISSIRFGDDTQSLTTKAMARTFDDRFATFLRLRMSEFGNLREVRPRRGTSHMAPGVVFLDALFDDGVLPMRVRFARGRIASLEID